MLQLMAVVTLAVGVFFAAPVLADQSGVVKGACDATNGQTTDGQARQLPGCTSEQRLVDKNGTTDPYIAKLINTFIYIAGAVSFIALLIGSIRYLTSTGDAARIQQAKDVVFYAIVGLVTALLARAIVAFVVGGVKI